MRLLKTYAGLCDVETGTMYSNLPNIPDNLYFTTADTYNLQTVGWVTSNVKSMVKSLKPVSLHPLTEKFIFATHTLTPMDTASAAVSMCKEFSNMHQEISTPNIHLCFKKSVIQYVDVKTRKIMAFSTEDTSIEEVFLMDSLLRCTVTEQEQLHKELPIPVKFPYFPINNLQYN